MLGPPQRYRVRVLGGRCPVPSGDSLASRTSLPRTPRLQLMSLEASPYRAQRTASALVARLQAHASASSTDSTDSMDADEGGRRGSSSREPDSTSVRVSSRSGSSPDAAADE